MKEQVRLYIFYSSFLIKILRFLVFVFILAVLYYDVLGNVFPKIPLFLCGIFFMQEVFYHFKIASITPPKKVSEITPHTNDIFALLNVFTKEATIPFVMGDLGENLQKLIKSPQSTFLFTRANFSQKDLKIIHVNHSELLQKAYDLALQTNSEYVSSSHVLGAYLLVSEPETKLLFNNNLKTNDIEPLVFWTYMNFITHEVPHPIRMHLTGAGLGEFLLTGWTPETQKYTKDIFTEETFKNKKLVGRDDEFTLVIQALGKHENNNVLLVGERGSGKETLVKYLAFKSFKNEVPAFLANKRIFELLTGALLAGAKERSELEIRLQNIIDEISHAGDVILYIPELQNVLGAGTYNLNISATFIPYLRGGKLPIIATIDPQNYKLYLEKNSLQDSFSVIEIPPATETNTLHMMFEKANKLQIQYNVLITYKAVQATVEYAKRYDTLSVFPGSASRLLEDVVNMQAQSGVKERKVTEENVITLVETKTHSPVSKPKPQEKELLLHLEDKLHERVIDQKQAISAIAESMRRLRSGMKNTNKPVSFLFLGPTGVGKTETAKALADLYYGGEAKMIRLDMSEYAQDDGQKRLLGSLPGQGEQRGELTEKVRDNPFSLVLLDEFEKANKSILDLFLQVFDDGRLTDNKGNTVSFDDTIIIATSNAGSEFIRQALENNEPLDKNFHQKLLSYLQEHAIFKPELLNRFDDIIIFTPLGDLELQEVTKLLLKKVQDKLLKQDITISFTDEVIKKIVKDGYNQQFGARPLDRYIQNSIEDPVAQKILSDEIKRGDNVQVSINNDSIFIHS